MSQHHLPAGCHDAETAAQLLSMSKVALLKKMRELGWLNTGGGSGNHNLPRREFVKNGFLCTQDRGYCLKGKKEISKSYRVMLLTQTGFNALKNELAELKAQPKKMALVTATQAHAVVQIASAQLTEQEKPFDRESAEAEREKTLEQMREWGLAS